MNVTEFSEGWQQRWQQKFTTPTAIQEAVFEPLRKKAHVVGISPTGTGKTIAYLLPLLTWSNRERGQSALIVTSSKNWPCK